jgi:RecA-family ATPase
MNKPITQQEKEKIIAFLKDFLKDKEWSQEKKDEILKSVEVQESEQDLEKFCELYKGILPCFEEIKTKVGIEKTEKLKVFSLKDLNDLEIQPIVWVVNSLIPEKSIVIIGGKRGTFKSFNAICLSICVASGMPFLNVFETQKKRVLYVDEENGIAILKERTQKILNGLNLTDQKEIKENLFFSSFENLKLDIGVWRWKLEKAIIEFKPEVIVIDSLRRVVSFDENVAGEMSKLFTDIIRPLSEKYNLTWILLHHLRKGISGRAPVDEMDEIRGSSDLANYSDVIIILDRKRGDADKFILKQVKCRRSPEIPSKLVQLTWNENNLKIECIGDAQETIFADQMCAEMIMNWLSENQKAQFKTKDVLEAMTQQKQSRASVYRGLDLLQEGDKPKIRKVSRGSFEINTQAKLK